MKMAVGIVLILSIIPCLSHKRLWWPTPRSSDDGPDDNPPCGGTSFEQAYEAGLVTDLNAGDKIEIIIYERIFHEGQPMRLAISDENDEDFESGIWLNHIPQHIRDQGISRNLTIPLTVPDFTCKNCTLQLMAFQTNGLNDNTCCAYTSNATKSCPIAQYYSCANININGGKRSRSDVLVQPQGWAYRDYACNYYRSESSRSAWEPEDDEITLKLKTSGDIDGRLDEDTFCGGVDEEILDRFPLNSQCQRNPKDFTQLSLVEGGDLNGDGIVGIIVVVVLMVVIGATYFITRNKGAKKKNNTSEADNF